jgi:hypothetical protein
MWFFFLYGFCPIDTLMMIAFAELLILRGMKATQLREDVDVILLSSAAHILAC